MSKKESLADAFRAFEARGIPINIFELDKLNEFDLLKQKQETINERYNYPATFVVGLYNGDAKGYERVHVIEGFLPSGHYELIRAVSDYYSSDSTYLDNIQLTDTINLDNNDGFTLKDTLYRISNDNIQSSYKMKVKKYIVLVYRKTARLKDSTVDSFIMWKREIVTLKDGDIVAERLDTMNEHLF